jgi:DNA ligase-1
MVELVQPKRVYTVHGYVEEFAQTLRGRGIEAWALGVDNQMELDLRSTAHAEGGFALGMTGPTE